MTSFEIYRYRRDAGYLDTVPDHKRGQANADFIRAEVAAGRLKAVTVRDEGVEYLDFLPASGKITLALS